MVQISLPTVSREGGQLRIEARVRSEGSGDDHIDQTLWFRIPADRLPTDEAIADAYFQVGLLLAMGYDGKLEMETPISARLLHHSEELQDVLTNWYPRRLRRAVIEVPARDPAIPEAASGGAVSFFSGGVDSFDTAMRQSASITHLAFVHGFDVPLVDTQFHRDVLGRLQAAAQLLGKPLLAVATNMRQLTNPRAHWGRVAHGAGLSAVGTLLQPYGRTLYIPSSYPYRTIHPWGSHPLIDRLHSTEYLEVIHEGAALNRVDKTLLILDSAAVRQHLRVCFGKGAYNCGECEKCLRTMTTLKLAGALDAFEVFPDTFDLERLRNLRFSNPEFTRENYRYARAVGDEEIARALKVALRRYRLARTPQPEQRPPARKPPPSTAAKLARYVPAPLRPSLRGMWHGLRPTRSARAGGAGDKTP
ncbi:MAG: hypothetical protein KIT69_03945 [Propionibacteriaceae bacterium]|nr:hypothetical protein [Propionibacteriaceae bacterium]